jgi:hypothetical protein
VVDGSIIAIAINTNIGSVQSIEAPGGVAPALGGLPGTPSVRKEQYSLSEGRGLDIDLVRVGDMVALIRVSAGIDVTGNECEPGIRIDMSAILSDRGAPNGTNSTTHATPASARTETSGWRHSQRRAFTALRTR